MEFRKTSHCFICTEAILEVLKYAGTKGAKSMYSLGSRWLPLEPALALCPGRRKVLPAFLTPSSLGPGGREQVATRKLLCQLLVGCGWGTHSPGERDFRGSHLEVLPSQVLLSLFSRGTFCCLLNVTVKVHFGSLTHRISNPGENESHFLPVPPI